MSQTEAANARASDRVWFWKINGLSVVIALLSLLIFYLVRNHPNSPVVLVGFGLFVVAWLMGPVAAVVRIGRAIRRRGFPRQSQTSPQDRAADVQPSTAHHRTSVRTAAISTGAVWGLLVLLTNEIAIPLAFGGVRPALTAVLGTVALAVVLGSLGVVLYDRMVRRWSLARLTSRIAAGAISGALAFLTGSWVPLDVGVARQWAMSAGLHVIAALINGAVVGAILVLGANAWETRRRANEGRRSTYWRIASR